MFGREESGNPACIVDLTIRKNVSPLAKDLLDPERSGFGTGSFWCTWEFDGDPVPDDIRLEGSQRSIQIRVAISASLELFSGDPLSFCQSKFLDIQLSGEVDICSPPRQKKMVIGIPCRS